MRGREGKSKEVFLASGSSTDLIPTSSHFQSEKHVYSSPRREKISNYPLFFPYYISFMSEIVQTHMENIRGNGKSFTLLICGLKEEEEEQEDIGMH